MSGGKPSEYTCSAMDMRVRNVQNWRNANAGYQNALLNNGSRFMKDYMAALSDGRNTWQPTWETEVGTTVQNATEKVTKNYVVDYLSVANRDIMVESEGQYTQRYVYDENSRRISAEFDYGEGTQRGEPGENIASDTAVNELGKVWYRTSLLGSTLFAVDETGEVVSHAIYDPWGNPLTETKSDLNFSGMDNLNNYTGYTWDETLGLYFAQNRFYDAENHRFTQEDPVKDGGNWYVYCVNTPLLSTDASGNTVAFVVGGAIIGGFVGFLSQVTINIVSGNRWSQGVASAAAGGAVYGAVFGATLNVAAASYAGAATVAAIDASVSIYKGTDAGEAIGNALVSTAVNGTLSFVMNKGVGAFIKTNNSWFQPQKLLSFFTKSYGQKIMAQTVAVGAINTAVVTFVMNSEPIVERIQEFLGVVNVGDAGYGNYGPKTTTAVTEWQKKLVAAGYLQMPICTSYGYWGNLTNDATVKFLKDNVSFTSTH